MFAFWIQSFIGNKYNEFCNDIICIEHISCTTTYFETTQDRIPLVQEAVQEGWKPESSVVGAEAHEYLQMMSWVGKQSAGRMIKHFKKHKDTNNTTFKIQKCSNEKAIRNSKSIFFFSIEPSSQDVMIDVREEDDAYFGSGSEQEDDEGKNNKDEEEEESHEGWATSRCSRQFFQIQKTNNDK